MLKGRYLLSSLDIRRYSVLKDEVIPDTGLWLQNVRVVDCYRMAELWIETRWLQRLHFCGRFLSEYHLDWYWKLELEDVFVSCGGADLMHGSSDFNPDVLPVTHRWTVFGRFSHVKVLTLCSLSLRYIAASGDFYNFPAPYDGDD